MNIEDYEFKGKLNKKENQLIARIISTYRERYEIVCDYGETFARLKQSSYYDKQKKYLSNNW